MTATLRSTTAPELGPGGRRLVIDCRHGTTYIDQFIPPTGSPVVLSERAMVALAVTRHEAEEGCGCARGLDTLVRAKRGASA
jgi:hypothetical protein